MSGSDSQTRHAIVAMFFVVLTIASVTPIQSYDYFWHLATGEWILDHRALPETDPFSVSSDPIRWINGAWLFQVGATLVDRVSGATGTSIARGVLVGLVFAIGFATLLRRADPAAALLVTAISVWGADHRLTTRPETVATLFLVAALWLLLEQKPSASVAATFVSVTVVWMQCHPSALLAPVVGGLVLAGRFIAGERGRELLWRVVLVAGSGLGLLANPWGLEGVLAPVRLTSLVGSGAFVNTEWLPTRLGDFPIVYLAAIGIVVAIVARHRWREDASRILLLAFFAALAFRYVRNHGFFFAAVPLVVAPMIPAVTSGRVRAGLALATTLLLVGLVVKHDGVRVGVDADRFPVAAVDELQRSGLKGNIYNPDQLGGYLIRSFYPERRALTDGRNELHVSYIEEYAKARLDQRAWHALLDRYEIALAVDEYHRETIEVVDAGSGERHRMPVSLIYFPRSQWALIGFDDVAMVFARRDRFDAESLGRMEFETLVPDGAYPFVDASPETIGRARREVERARSLFGDQRSIDRMEVLLGVQ